MLGERPVTRDQELRPTDTGWPRRGYVDEQIEPLLCVQASDGEDAWWVVQAGVGVGRDEGGGQRRRHLTQPYPRCPRRSSTFDEVGGRAEHQGAAPGAENLEPAVQRSRGGRTQRRVVPGGDEGPHAGGRRCSRCAHAVRVGYVVVGGQWAEFGVRLAPTAE